MPTLLVSLALVTGLALRLLHLDALHGTPLFESPTVDALEHYQVAWQLAAGTFEYQVPARAPLYPWLLSWFCQQDRAADMYLLRLLTSLGGIAAAALLYFGGRRSLGVLPAASAAILLALYRPGLLYDCELYAASLAQLLVVGVLVCCAALLRGIRPGPLVGLGLCLGLASVTRSNLLVLTPLCILLLCWKGGLRGRTLLLLCGLSLAPVLWVCGLNYQAEGGFAFIQGRTGHNLYMANHRGSDGTVDIRPGPQHEAFYRRPAVEAQVYGRIAESAWFSAQTRAEIAAAPLEWCGLLLRKVYNSFAPVEVASSYHNEGHRLYSWVLRLWLPGFAWLWPLALLGLCRLRGRDPVGLLIWTSLAALFATMLLGFPGGRYRYQIAGICCLLAGLGIEALWQARQQRGLLLRRLGIAAGGLLMVLLGPRFHEQTRRWQAEYKTLEAQSLIQLHSQQLQGRDRGPKVRDYLIRAHAAAKAAAQLAPESAWAAFTLGAIATHGRDGRPMSPGAQPRLALRYFEKASELFENFPEAWLNQGLMHMALSQAEAARRALRRAVELWPDMQAAWGYLAQVEDRLGNVAAARQARQAAAAAAQRLKPKG